MTKETSAASLLTIYRIDRQTHDVWPDESFPEHKLGKALLLLDELNGSKRYATGDDRFVLGQGRRIIYDPELNVPGLLPARFG